MSLTLRVLAPDQSVFDGIADEVILPSTTGQVGILPGHVTMLAALDTGVMRLRDGNGWSTIALMGGFAEVEADEVTVLVNAAELGSSINASTAEAEFEEHVEERRCSHEQRCARSGISPGCGGGRQWIGSTGAAGS